MKNACACRWVLKSPQSQSDPCGLCGSHPGVSVGVLVGVGVGDGGTVGVALTVGITVTSTFTSTRGA